ncbi:MAG: S-adenosyl-l-methionine hydroxide adenosyltransferase family protein [Verrucomicrobiae bacterium]|nr:S-adenosyl-l-methionine hydroxide adenosyltransferase family protein [Verrucomicrobiae bacterium]
MPLITLLTDFGTCDWFVAAMKGVIAGIAPDARVVDVTHDISGQDVLAGAFVLAQCCRHFPPGTIHVAVVDPGVGSPRRAIAVKAGDYVFLAPDNGVLTAAVAAVGGRRPPEIRAIENERLFNHPVSRTFHGRDIFAPVAAHLAAGVAFEELGPVMEEMARLETAEPKLTKKGLEGRVVFVDRFGNLITNIEARHLEQLPGGEPKSFRIGRHVIRKFGRFYAEAPPGGAIALIGSSNRVELCVNLGSAAKKFRAKAGDVVTAR